MNDTVLSCSGKVGKINFSTGKNSCLLEGPGVVYCLFYCLCVCQMQFEKWPRTVSQLFFFFLLKQNFLSAKITCWEEKRRKFFFRFCWKEDGCYDEREICEDLRQKENHLPKFLLFLMIWSFVNLFLLILVKKKSFLGFVYRKVIISREEVWEREREKMELVVVSKVVHVVTKLDKWDK